MPLTKVQFNVYLQRRFKNYIEDIVDTTEVDSNSDAVTILIAYAMKHFTAEDWDKLAGQIKVFGIEGLEKV